MLTANGHRLEDVLNYTMRRIVVLTDTVMERKRDDLASLVVGIRGSQMPDGKKFVKFLESIGDNSGGGDN